MSESHSTPEYGRIWFQALADQKLDLTTPLAPSIKVGATAVNGERAAVLAVVPDRDARFPRARSGEVGLEEGWGFAAAIDEIVADDSDAETKRPILVVVDVPSQAYGYVEELAGLHQALAASADALAGARLAGHPVTAFIVGKAISGAFLATGLQANRIVALDHPDIMVQVMGKAAAARITMRTIDELDEAAKAEPATAYDGPSFASLGAVHQVVHVEQPAGPTADDMATARKALDSATADIRADGTGLESRLTSPGAKAQRAATIEVREAVAAAWDE